MDILKFWTVGFVRRFAPNRTPKIAAMFWSNCKTQDIPRANQNMLARKFIAHNCLPLLTCDYRCNIYMYLSLNYPIASMGLVYLPTSTVNVGKYTSSMDGMGISIPFVLTSPFPFISVQHGWVGPAPAEGEPTESYHLFVQTSSRRKKKRDMTETSRSYHHGNWVV